ncbi:MAG: hypothetical protein JWP32_2886 [Schumannella sp.]|nr:hypothetical protein [Schumannella sp.]
MSVGIRQVLPSARELFPVLRRRLLESRPIIEPAKFAKVPTLVNGKVRRIEKQIAPPKYGKPMFRNVIDPVTGKHV